MKGRLLSLLYANNNCPASPSFLLDSLYPEMPKIIILYLVFFVIKVLYLEASLETWNYYKSGTSHSFVFGVYVWK